MKNRTLHLPLIIEQDEDNIFIVTCLTLKGCHSYGRTIAGAMENIREAIAVCIEDEEQIELNEFVGFREIEVVV
jgi:predicted RNase H-like HicB family nuclease